MIFLSLILIQSFLSFSGDVHIVFHVVGVCAGVLSESCRSVREVLSRATVPTVPVVYGGDSHNAWAGDGGDDQKHRSPNRSPMSHMKYLEVC